MGPTVTLTGAPANAVILLLVACWMVPVFHGTRYVTRWMVDRHMDKLKPVEGDNAVPER